LISKTYFKFDDLLFYFALLGWIFLLLICFNTYNYADDYMHKYLLSQNSFIPFIKNLNFYYNTHLGRAYSPSVIVSWYLAGTVSVNILTTIWLLAHFLNCIFVYKIALFKRILVKKDFIFISVLLAFSWVGMKTHIGYNVFWAVGGYMTISALQVLFAFYLILNNVEIKGFWKITCISLLFFSIGTLAENISFAFGVMLLILVFYHYFKNNKIKWDLILLFLPFLIGFSLVFFAPGTQQRMLDEGVDYSLFSSLKNFIYLIGFYLFRNKVLIGLSILFGFYIWFSGIVKFSISRKVYFKRAFFFLILCLLVTLPFSVMPSMSFVKRAGYFFSFFSVGLSIILGGYLYSKISALLSFKTVNTSIKALLVICIIYLVFNFVDQLNLVIDVSRQMTERQKILIESKNSQSLDVVLMPIALDEKLFTTRLLELSTDSTYIENIRLAKYFHLNSVRIKD
jgi:hypothetical protein